MKDFIIFYCVIAYLFEIGASMHPDGSNWWNLLFAPIVVPIHMGRYMAYTLDSITDR